MFLIKLIRKEQAMRTTIYDINLFNGISKNSLVNAKLIILLSLHL